MANHATPHNRFADYFVICGLDASSGLEPDRLSGDSLHCAPLDRPFKSKVLAHYPDSVPWNTFDEDAVGMLCMPHGLSFKSKKDKRLTSFHSFLITREDGTHGYGIALIFYEEVTSLDVCSAMETLQSMHTTDTSFSVPCLTVNSDEGHLLADNRLGHRMKSQQSGYDNSSDKLYVTKCICLITSLPFIVPCRAFLRHLYQHAMRPSSFVLPLEVYIHNVLYDVPQLPPGRSMKFYGPGGPIFCQRPKYQQLMLVAEGINCLAFPFTWQHVYVPILPASLIHFLDAPVPFIMGLCGTGEYNPSVEDSLSEVNMCFVDLDKATVRVPEDLPFLPYANDLKEELRQTLNYYGSVFAEEIEAHCNELPSLRSGICKSGGGRARLLAKSDRNCSCPSSPRRMDVLQQSETWKKISNLAKRTGVWDSIEDLVEEEAQHAACMGGGQSDSLTDLQETNENAIISKLELNHLKFNNAVKQIFLNCFVQIFAGYDNFVVNTSKDMESWLKSRETVYNFDKTGFLSDQPECHLRFLSSFTETQMFTTFIDNKIASQWEEIDPYLCVFDMRIKSIQESGGEGHRFRFQPCNWIEETGDIIDKRATNIDFIVPQPQSSSDADGLSKGKPGFFPSLCSTFLNTENPSCRSKIRETAKWRKKDRSLQHVEHLRLNSDQRERYIQEARSKQMCQPVISDMSAASMVQTNWKFVGTLLKECKNKTKKILVKKMGHEAIELGHEEGMLKGVEENTLIASLADLLERIWSHGLQTKKSRSALWSHLVSYQETLEGNESINPVDPKLLAPGLSTFGLDSEKIVKPPHVHSHRRSYSQGRVEFPVLRPLPKSLFIDMKRVRNVTDLRSDMGFTRAWVRLALECKTLSSDLKELLADTGLLRSLYKRYAFLRCEEEREQFLFHLLSLNAVDFFCFTNRFTNTMMTYRVLVYPSSKFTCSTTSANVWLSVTGHLGGSGSIQLGKGLLELTFNHKNLGKLTTMHIGHDNSGLSPKWLVEYVLVRNEFTGHIHRFNCGRWLGKGVDDGSTERLLVAELIYGVVDMENEELAVGQSPRSDSPKSPQKNLDPTIPQLQEMVGYAVNNIMKHFYKPQEEACKTIPGGVGRVSGDAGALSEHDVKTLITPNRTKFQSGNLPFLLCGEKGIVQCLEQIFQFGFRSSRLFRNRIFIWDYLERLRLYFDNALANCGVRPIPEVTKAGYWLFCNLINEINHASEAIGKDGKLQIFILIGLRDHCLHRWLPIMASTTVTGQMYEENSFLRDSVLINFLIQILESISQLEITLESSLLRGLDV